MKNRKTKQKEPSLIEPHTLVQRQREKEVTAKWIKASGKVVRVEPANGRDFSLEELQGFVGGMMEILPVPRHPDKWMIVNEVGKLMRLPYNPDATGLAFPLFDLIVGDVLLCRKEQVQ